MKHGTRLHSAVPTACTRTPSCLSKNTGVRPLDESYRVDDEILGEGSYAQVHSACNVMNGEKVAIKVIDRVFASVSDAKRVVREVYLLRQLDHPGIVPLIDIFLPRTDLTPSNLYLVFPRMDRDLRSLGRSAFMDCSRIRMILHQILAAVCYLHSKNVIHRDLKPANVLTHSLSTGRTIVQICDFGLARTMPRSTKAVDRAMTTGVQTRWYRAPEVMLTNGQYGMPVDIWSTGCILAEMLGRGRPVFPGANEREQMLLIVKKLGSPVIYESSFIKHPTARSFMRSLPPQRKVPWCSVFGEAETSLLDLLDRMLCFDPELRITAIEALEHEAVAEQSTLRECSRCGSNFTNSIRQSITNQRTQDYTVDLGTVERAPANEDSYRLLLLSQVFDLHVCQNVVDRQEETPSARSRCGRRSSWAS